MKNLPIFIFCSAMIGTTHAAYSCDGTVQECAQQAAEQAARIEGLMNLLIPEGAVMAFALDECPAPYWEPYEPAQGRFVRGVDPRAERDFIESGVDEGKPRSFGSVQDDMLAAHSHTQRYVDTKGHFNQDGWEYVPFVKGGVNANGSDTTKVGGRETRPINVALLYCVRK